MSLPAPESDEELRRDVLGCRLLMDGWLVPTGDWLGTELAVAHEQLEFEAPERRRQFAADARHVRMRWYSWQAVITAQIVRGVPDRITVEIMSVSDLPRRRSHSDMWRPLRLAGPERERCVAAGVWLQPLSQTYKYYRPDTDVLHPRPISVFSADATMCSPQRKVIISQLIDPSEGELDTLVEILSAAFQNDVGMASLSGNSTRVQSDIYRRTLRASSKQGQLHVGRFEDDPANQIRGLAAWIAPGEDWQCYQQEPFIEGLSSYLREWYEYHYIPTYEELYKLSFRSGAEARQGSFNLKFLAVRPDSQGKRIGTELLTKLCNQADADGRHVLADVKSHFHVQWFRKYSFTYRSVKNFTSKDCAGFPLWCMARDPR